MGNCCQLQHPMSALQRWFGSPAIPSSLRSLPCLIHLCWFNCHCAARPPGEWGDGLVAHPLPGNGDVLAGQLPPRFIPGLCSHPASPRTTSQRCSAGMPLAWAHSTSCHSPLQAVPKCCPCLLTPHEWGCGAFAVKTAEK